MTGSQIDKKKRKKKRERWSYQEIKRQDASEWKKQQTNKKYNKYFSFHVS